MKKLLNISVIAALAVLPMAANAARTVTTGNAATGGSQTALATTSYVQGAYNAMNTKVDAVITDSAVATKEEGNYAAIHAGDSVSENLVALDTAIAGLNSSTNTTTGNLNNLSTEAKTNLVAAINEVDSHADTNATAIALLNNSDNTVTGSVKNSIKTQAAGADYDHTTSGLSATTITGAIDEVEGRVDTLESKTTVAAKQNGTYTAISAGSDVNTNLVALDTAIGNINTASGSLSADGNYITTTNTVSQNLSALDTQVKANEDDIDTIYGKQIPIVSDWTSNAVTNTTIASLSGIDCELPANASNAACLRAS